MKRHKQLPGVRRWFGQDFIDLQQEALNAIEGLLAPFNSCVLKGCEVSGTDPKTINPGLVLFTSGYGTERLSIIAEFAGASGLPSTFVRFLVPEEEEISRLYDDGIVKPIAIQQRAVLTSVEPSTGAYIAIASSGSPVSLRDAIQSNMYRFVTDADKLNWNGKLNASEVSTVPTASKALKLNASAKFPNSVVTEDATHRFATDAEKTDWNGKAAGNHNHTLASLSEKNYDSLTGLPALLVQKTGFALGSVTDLNTLDTPGFYFGASIANSPFAGEIFIDVIKSSAEIVIQVVKKTGAFAIRTRTSSLMGDPVWSAWTKWGSIASSSQKMLYSDGANGADAASFVHVDPTNSRIGIGTNTPQKTLDVVGETRVGSTYKTNFNGNEIQFERNGFNYVTAVAGSSGQIGIIAGNRTVTEANCNVVFKADQTSIFKGNVGVKASPSTYELTVEGRIFASDNIIAFSDQRFKTVIRPLKDVLKRIKNINPVQFFWKTDKEKKPQIGMLAQEIEPEFPELVFTDDQGKKAVSYMNFTAVLLAAVKELSEEIELLKQRLQ